VSVWRPGTTTATACLAQADFSCHDGCSRLGTLFTCTPQPKLCPALAAGPTVTFGRSNDNASVLLTKDKKMRSTMRACKDCAPVLLAVEVQSHLRGGEHGCRME